MSVRFVEFVTVTEDGTALSTCLINVTEILHLTPSLVPALNPKGYLTATLITFRGGDRKRVMGDPNKVAASIEEALCTSQKQEPR